MDKNDGAASLVRSDALLDDDSEFDLSKLKMELNTVTIMYGPPDATIRQAEKAMMAYINALCPDTSNRGMNDMRDANQHGGGQKATEPGADVSGCKPKGGES